MQELDISLFFLIFKVFYCRKLYCFHLVQDLGEGSRVVKKVPCGCRAGVLAEAQAPEGLLKGHWAPEAPSCA